MRAALLLSVVFLVATAQGASSQGLVERTPSRQRFERELRVIQGQSRALEQNDDGTTANSNSAFSRERLQRLQHGVYSLAVPGWSQYRRGDKGRALAFASTELVIWGSYIFSRLQGEYREDRYRDWAQQFAGVGDLGIDDDDFWRNVGRYADSEEYNNRVRRDNRQAIFEAEINGETVDIDINDGVLSPEDGWLWSSARRQEEYRSLRADSNSAFERADFILVFALVNRVIAFADALRSGPASDDGQATLLRAGDVALGLDLEPDLVDPVAKLQLRGRF